MKADFVKDMAAHLDDEAFRDDYEGEGTPEEQHQINEAMADRIPAPVRGIIPDDRSFMRPDLVADVLRFYAKRLEQLATLAGNCVVLDNGVGREDALLSVESQVRVDAAKLLQFDVTYDPARGD